MAHYHIDLAFSCDSVQIGSNFGKPSPYYPLQFALVDGDSSRFNTGPSGGFSGGDTFTLNVYDITSLDQGSSAKVSSASVMIFGQSIQGTGDIRTVLASPLPAGSKETKSGGGLAYGNLLSGSGDSAAYGQNLPVYSLNDPDPTFTIANPESDTEIKLSFGFELDGRTYIVDPEMAVGRGG